jgi:hypothetical protein
LIVLFAGVKKATRGSSLVDVLVFGIEYPFKGIDVQSGVS